MNTDPIEERASELAAIVERAAEPNYPERSGAAQVRAGLKAIADRRLLLTELDRLRAIEAAARDLLTAIDAKDEANVHGWSEALRAALETPE